jgi:hypothetical protein
VFWDNIPAVKAIDHRIVLLALFTQVLWLQPILAWFILWLEKNGCFFGSLRRKPMQVCEALFDRSIDKLGWDFGPKSMR